MSLLGSEENNGTKLTEQEQAAWELYCKETQDSLDVKDFWCEIPYLLQELYLARV
jgi:hypothetical protein